MKPVVRRVPPLVRWVDRGAYFGAAIPALVLCLALAGTVVHLVLQTVPVGGGALGRWGELVGLLRGSLELGAVTVAIASPVALLGAVLAVLRLEPRSRARLSDLLAAFAAVPAVAAGFVFAREVGPHLARATGWPSLHPLLAALAMAAGFVPWLWCRFQRELEDFPRSPWFDAALALGASRSQVATGLAVPIALPRLWLHLMRALVRATGETTAVLLVSGNAASSWWGGGSHGATVGAALVSSLPESTVGSPEWAFLHRAALALLLCTLGFQVWAEHLRRTRPALREEAR